MTWTDRRVSEAARGLAARRGRLGLSVDERAMAAQIDDLLATRLGDSWWPYYREAAYLPKLFDEGERVLDLAVAQLMFAAGMLALTDRRLLFLRCRTYLPGRKVKSYPLSRIIRHRVIRQGRRLARLDIELRATWWKPEFHHMRPEDAARISSQLGG